MLLLAEPSGEAQGIQFRCWLRTVHRGGRRECRGYMLILLTFLQ